MFDILRARGASPAIQEIPYFMLGGARRMWFGEVVTHRAGALAVVVALGGGCASDDSLGIAISDSSFGDPITIAAGKELTITNLDEADHTWTSSECRSIFKRPICDEIGFDSGLLSQNGTFSYAFDEPGEYSFFCETHPSMTGTINVSP